MFKINTMLSFGQVGGDLLACIWDQLAAHGFTGATIESPVVLCCDPE